MKKTISVQNISYLPDYIDQKWWGQRIKIEDSYWLVHPTFGGHRPYGKYPINFTSTTGGPHCDAEYFFADFTKQDQKKMLIGILRGML